MSRSKIVGITAALAFAITAPFLAGHEGKELVGYVDPVVGIPTACMGHTATAVVGKKYTEAECMKLLEGDYKHAFTTLQRRARVFLYLNEGEVMGYSSFIFNLGSGNFATSTLLKELNAERYRQACNQILQWDMAGKMDCSKNANAQKCGGIWARRLDERDYCMYGKDVVEARKAQP